MKILQISPKPFHPDRGGLYVVQKSFSNLIAAKTLDTIPMNSSVSAESEADYHLQQLNVFNFGANYGIPIVTYKLLSQLWALELNLITIHCLFQFHAVIGYVLSKIKKVPYIVFLHGTLDPYVFSYRAIPKYLWMYGMGQRILQQASAVICTSNREAEKASAYLRNSNVEICPLGIEVPDLPGIVQYKNQVREKLGIDKSKKILLFLGRIDPMKRPIETALAFKENNPQDWVYLMVGSLSKSEKYCLELVVDNQQVYYHHSVYGLDKWIFMAAADAFIHLSYRENFCYSVAEAAALALPLIISDGIDIHPILEEAGGADVITIDSEEDIHKGLAKFLDKSEMEQKAMGERAKKVFQENFCQSVFQDRLVKLIKKYARENHF